MVRQVMGLVLIGGRLIPTGRNEAALIVAGRDEWERRARILCVVIGAFLILHTAVSCTYWDKGTHDQAVYWMAGERVVEGDAKLYAPPGDDSNMVGIFIYPPAFAALFAPITLLSRPAGHAIWAVFQVVVLMACLPVLLSVAGTRKWTALAVAAVALLWPLMANISAGQVNTLLLLLVLLAWRSVDTGHPWRAGFLIALGAHIKVLPVVLLPMLLVQRRFKAALATATFGLLLIALPAVWTIPAKGFAPGCAAVWEMNVAFVGQLVKPRLLSQFAIDAGGLAPGNLSLSAQFGRWFAYDGGSPSGNSVRWLGFAVAAIMYAAALCAARENPWRKFELRPWGLCLIAGMLGNPLVWPAHLVLLALLVVPTVARESSLWMRMAAGSFALCFTMPALLANQLLLPTVVYDTWCSVQAAGLPLILVILFWTAAMFARPAPTHEVCESGSPQVAERSI